ncbi:squalene--hopene cyclase [Candidatus Deferrimicrobium sp.]|uniref:squalene--hopene cyclase n=1 Tax=Candidatus Deferrimicrobium sp. TaxID=3060586 RepID=UPI0039C86DE5
MNNLQNVTMPAAELLDDAIREELARFLSIRNPDGYWVFDLEADATIPAEYLLLHRFLGRAIDPGRRERIARSIRRSQLPDGGWPLYRDGAPDVSASVKAYFALKLAGDPPDAPHMTEARRRILDLGGAEKANVFTRITLALFGQIPWRTVPAIPVEIMHLPRWFFFHLDKVSYWSRTVMVPLFILCTKRPVCALAAEEGVPELFAKPPGSLRHLDRYVPGRTRKNAFILLDRLLKRVDPFMPRVSRERAIRLAERWTRDRMQGEGGIGAIFPAMANAVMALKILGYSPDDPDYARGLKSLDGLVLERGDELLCQPCHSPVWDTCLTLCTVLEAGLPRGHAAVRAAVEWLFERQVFVRGDWARRAPRLEPGAWAFQFENVFYPDVDDTAKVVIALIRAGVLENGKQRENLAAAVNWVAGMQSADGGWGAFDVDNNFLYLNDIPFADHGALLDPSTADVTARCVEMFSLLGYRRDFPPVARALRFLEKEQEACGAWFGRWGVNYIYGTWSVLIALRQAGEDMSRPHVVKAVQWLKSCQNPDGGWGESCRSYDDPSLAGLGTSTPSQTSWALLGLMAAGQADSEAVRRGIRYLLDGRNAGGGWDETLYTGTGFPKVFYLRYHGYASFFPLWALGAYRRIVSSGKFLEDEVRRDEPPHGLRLQAAR